MIELHIVYFDRYSIISILSLSFLFNFISFSKSSNNSLIENIIFKKK